MSQLSEEKIIKILLRNPAFSDRQVFDFMEGAYERSSWTGFGLVIASFIRDKGRGERPGLLDLLADSASPEARKEAYRYMSTEAFTRKVNSIPENDYNEIDAAMRHRLMEPSSLGCGPLSPDTIARCFRHFMNDTEMVVALIEAVSPIPEKTKQLLLQHPDRNVRMLALNSIGQEEEIRMANEKQEQKEQIPNQAGQHSKQNLTRKL